MLGCAEAGLTGGHCASGAAGAAAESVLGDVVTAAGGLPTDASGQVTTGAAVAYETGAAALGALAGQAAGGDAQSGLNTAVNSAANNYVYHASILPGTKSEAQQLQDAQAGCARGDSSACATATALTQTSTSRDQELATACQQPGSMGCLFQKSLAYLAGNTIRTVDGVTVATPEPTPVYTPPNQQAATLNNMLGSPLAGILGGITYAAGGSTSTAYYVTTLGVATDGIAAGVAGLGGTSSVNVVDEGAPLPTSGLGVATNSAPDALVYNPQGAARATANSGNWSSGSLSETVQNIAGSNPQVTHTESGKTIYTNPTTGASVVYDNAGNYYRVQNAAGRYLDQSGNVIPNNVPLIGSNKTTQTGVPSGLRNGLTHFSNTDPVK